MPRDTYLSPLNAVLGEDPKDITVSRWVTGGTEHGLLKLGGHLALDATITNPAVLRRIAEAATELADWREQQIGRAS